MQGILAALEASPPAEALRASFVAYPLLNAFHVLAIGALVTSVILLDLRILGFLRTQPEEVFLPLMRRLALLAFAGTVVSGMALFSVQATTYAENPAFLVKMGLIVLAGLNFLLLARRRQAEPGSSASRASALLSLGLWPATLVAGRFIGFL